MAGRPALAPSPEWSDWYGRRAAVGEMLGLDVGPLASLQAGAAILAPLGTAVLGVLVPGAG